MSLPVGMDVGSHNISGRLLIFVACQELSQEKMQKSKDADDEKNYILILEVDQENGFRVSEKKRIYPQKPQITRIMYKKKYGLIMACYRGYIEHFDRNSFKSVNSWSNNMKAIGSDKNKVKADNY